ncbi:MAG: NADH-quinone oxidoreductase subunit NuoK [Candidatus Dadabacteria bacterium]|nr:NADH-quinone oxidoreductase subunit NuoK [Candidatus Dadabacteria bacterium]MCY4262735.1 NADH-quinone oxidoreductase subunit NuoK [Candidatus Dadabacteria bacterium]
MEITATHYVVLACVLFSIGVYGLITRKNILVVLMCLELMLNSCNLLFVAFSRLYESATGHVFVLMSVTVAAAEVAVGLAFVVSIYRQRESLDIDLLKLLRG